MIRRHVLLASLLLLSPATAFAQTLPAQPVLAEWAFPGLLGASLVLVGMGFALRANRWTRGIGIVLWMLWMTLGACLTIYAMPEAARATAWWQLPALVLGIFVFAGAGEHTLQEFRRA